MSAIPERWGPAMKKTYAKTITRGTGRTQRPPTRGKIGTGPVKGAASAYRKGGKLRR